MTSKLTREENVQAVFDLKAGYTLGLADVEILKRVARMALAAMDSELVAQPVMFIDGDISSDDADKLAKIIRKFNEEDERPLAKMARIIRENPHPTNECDMPKAQPAPTVPDGYQRLRELYHAQEKRLFKIAQRIKGPAFDKYSHSPSQAIDVLEGAIFGEDGACRAAMLNGGKP
ncbi:hypothetical protein [Klebsiella pneumoniae]|uniref:hypothetical protein n=1 Tax=Klebsiella pneumoniae TaxID=573 RepID=UPI0030EED1AE